MTTVGISAAALAGLCVLVIAIELGLRFRGGLPIPLLRHNPTRRAHSWQEFFKDNVAIRYHRRLGWTLTPNMRGNVEGITTDEHGNRLPSLEPRQLPIGAIVPCGNSVAAGAQVAHPHSSPPPGDPPVRS